MNWWVPTNGGGWKVDKWGDSASNGIYGDFQGTRGDKLEIQWGACMEVSHSFQHSGEPNFELEGGSVSDFKKCIGSHRKFTITNLLIRILTEDKQITILKYLGAILSMDLNWYQATDTNLVQKVPD